MTSGTGASGPDSEVTGSEAPGADSPGADRPDTDSPDSDTTVVTVPEAAAPQSDPGDRVPSGNVLTALRPVGIVSSWVMLICGILGMAGSAALSIERIELLKNPDYQASCNFSPVVSCSSVMTTQQAEFFGFPNPLLGLAAFAVILVTAVLSVGRAQLPRWYWIGQTAVAALGFVFINYLAFQSIYRIGALCPYCMVVWTVTPIILVLSLSPALGDGPTGRLLRDASWIVLAAWYLIVIIAAGERFWYYWRTLF
ncbi:vitamin K epoxide reductase family protein [Gordonia caeni]|uniref:Vitamin K epoxide reductase domain-containing protein n=1 Tax=Gordonia caeni TaxID=1007097 RepID=A0ABP7NRK5_9ACTN